MCVLRRSAAFTLQQVFLRHSPTPPFSALCRPFYLLIVASWRTTKSISASVPAGSATGLAGAPRAPSGRAPRRSLPRASGYPPRWRRTQSAGLGREGKRPVQRARPGRYGRRRAEGPERLEPGRQRRADPRPPRDGEGADREAQPAARRGARTVIRQREGGGRPPALSGARWRQPRRREGTGHASVKDGFISIPRGTVAALER